MAVIDLINIAVAAHGHDRQVRVLVFDLLANTDAFASLEAVIEYDNVGPDMINHAQHIDFVPRHWKHFEMLFFVKIRNVNCCLQLLIVLVVS